MRGTTKGKIQTFPAIPYAAPPTGENRWRQPQPAQPWRDVREATEQPARCTQAPLDGSAGVVGAEDCLYLTVTRPARNGRHRPVMVWLHGGGFMYGSGNDYDGSRLALGGDVIVVTVNYRLGIFGFLGHSELGREGDFGFADQAAALRWVRANAAAFGGDPRNVTLFGESAGAMSVCSQLTSPAAARLFDKAIIESGSCLTEYPKNGIAPGVPVYRPWQPKDTVAAAGAAATTELGCMDLACLRRLPVEKLATSDLMARFSFPAYGTDLLPADPAVALRAGAFPRVPVLQGSNLDEMRFYVSAALAGGLVIDPAKYDELLNDSFGPAAAQVRAAYPADRYSSPAVAWATVLTDAAWSCTTLDADRTLAAKTHTYGFEFADRNAPNAQQIPTVPALPFGAAHGTEMAYLFPFPGVTFTEAQQRLSAAMVNAWTRFARGGDPGWPRFTPGGNYVQSLAPDAMRRVDLAATHHCDLWERV